MKDFFGDKVLLNTKMALMLYNSVKDLPIIDYHCHLDIEKIASDAGFSDIGQLWLEGDHYKWRAMRLNGIDERYITGDASWHEKFIKYAQVVPRLIGNPLYYWTHMELKQIFGISKPLSAERAREWGLINDVLPAEQLEEKVRQVADLIASKAPLAVMKAKKGIGMYGASLEETLNFEAETSSVLLDTDDFREGVAAFKEKRQPVFQGR